MINFTNVFYVRSSLVGYQQISYYTFLTMHISQAYYFMRSAQYVVSVQVQLTCQYVRNIILFHFKVNLVIFACKYLSVSQKINNNNNNLCTENTFSVM